MDELKERILEIVKARAPEPVAMAEISAELLLPPDLVYKAVAVLLQEQKLEVVQQALDRELQLTPA
jgi:hypothetical protein